MTRSARGYSSGYAGFSAFRNQRPFSRTSRFKVLSPSIKAATINTNVDKRDEHLRSGDFFEAAKYPNIEFTSKKVTSSGEKKFKIEGDMTMHGVTKPITFEAEYLGADKDPGGKVRAGFTATSKISRTDFGMKFNKVLDSGKLMVGDEVNLNLEIEAVEKTK